jgi:hypothetical protein
MVVPFSANSTRKLTPPAATRLMRSQPSLPRGRYVRPTVNETLSAFCSHLTGIKQAQIDAAPTLPEVLAQFDEWRLALGLVHTDEENNFAFAVRIPRGLAPALACVVAWCAVTADLPMRAKPWWGPAGLRFAARQPHRTYFSLLTPAPPAASCRFPLTLLPATHSCTGLHCSGLHFTPVFPHCPYPRHPMPLSQAEYTYCTD